MTLSWKMKLRVVAVGILGLFAASCARPSASQGLVLYDTNGCASCHGREGHGDGPLSQNLPAKPIDLRDASLFKRGVTEDAIAKTLLEGVSQEHPIPALHASHHELLMPKFDHLTETERRSIALYVISLQTSVIQGRAQQ